MRPAAPLCPDAEVVAAAAPVWVPVAEPAALPVALPVAEPPFVGVAEEAG